MQDASRIFLVGIGGMGMAPLALYLKDAGCDVRGCDDRLTAPVRARLERAGIPCGKVAELPADCQVAVRSSAISESHPLLQCARARGLPIFRRGEFWARCVADRALTAVVGSHGKTTTSAMLVHLLARANLPFSYLVGGLPNDDAVPPARFEPNAEWVVSEIDESDGTIEGFAPAVTLALNFDWDHPDRYRDEAALERMFFDLFRRTRQCVIVPENCARLRAVAARAGVRVRTFAVADDFNETNAAAALAAAEEMTGARPPVEALETFRGIWRRQDVLLSRPRLKIIADYAHHPTEISALLKAVKKRNPDARVWAVFQPHRYSRTRQYAADFARAFDWADAVWLLPVYAASEPFDSKGTSGAIVSQWNAEKPLHPVEPPVLTAALEAALGACEARTVCVFIGAGDIDGMARDFVAALESDFARRLRGALSAATRLRSAEPLAPKTTFRVGGCADWYAEPANLDDLRALLAGAKATQTPVFVLGRGSNVLVPDAGFRGLVLRLSAPVFCEISLLPDGKIRAGAGARLKELCATAAAAGLTGFEGLEGIPATVGGALRMNAGAMGASMCDRLESLEFIDAEGVLRTLPRAQTHFAYRNCPELENACALSAVFACERDAPEAVRARMAAFAARRNAAQPKEPSAGCAFKNPQGDSAGRLIDAAGFKGARSGGARVSERHANFIVNAGGATQADVVALVKTVRDGVRKKYGVALTPEIRMLGGDWNSIL